MKTNLITINRPNIFDVMFNDVDVFNTSSIFKNSFFNDYNSNMNIAELDDKYLIELSIPGFSKDDVKIELKNKILEISGNINNDNDIKKENYHYKSFSKRNFKENLELSNNIDENNISAEFKNGILNITIPKIDKKENISKYIEIK